MWIYRGKSILGYTEPEVWRMTLKKLAVLFDKHMEWEGGKLSKQKQDPPSIDKLLGF